MRFVPSIISFLVILFLVSCGESGSHFKIEGHLLQMNQGEFYVYSTENGIEGIDTIKVQGGRFAYEVQCEHPMTLSLVFPNFSEVPIFAEPGKTVKVDGDASRLKKLEIKGTKTNELMSTFREQIAEASPPETKHLASQFIEDHPESVVGVWLVRKYFVATPNPDYKEALRLIKLMMGSQKGNGELVRLSNELASLSKCAVGRRLPSFTATDINGNVISSSSLMSGTVIICTWATWSFTSQNFLQQLKSKIDNGSQIKVITISVDASKKDCYSYVKMNQWTWPVICTGEMFDMQLLSQLGLLSVPTNIVVKNGTIIARDAQINNI